MKLEPDGVTGIDTRFVDPLPLAPLNPFERGNEPIRVAGETRQGAFQSITDGTQALRETGKALEESSSHRHSL